MLSRRLIAAALVAASTEAAGVKFADKWQIFCGEPDCYEELGILPNATKAQIRKSYRKLSMEFHPDKNIGDVKAVERFNRVAKANEILTSDEDRKKLDYYTENPSEYWSLYGTFVEVKYAPKTDVRVALLILLIFASLISPAIQFSKNKNYLSKVTKAALEKLPLTGGGAPEALALRKEAEDLLKLEIKTLAADKKAPKMTSREEKLKLAEIIAKLVSELEVTSGEFRKPEWNDLPVVAFFRVPLKYAAAKYQEASIGAKIAKGESLTEDEKQITIERHLGGPSEWDALTDAQQDKLLETECWKKTNFDAWKAGNDTADTTQPGLTVASKKALRQRKKPAGRFISDD